MSQSYTDIWKKLQKLENFTEMNTTQLQEITNKVFVNWNWEAQKEAERLMKEKVSLLVATLENLDQTKKPGPSTKD